MRQNMLRTLKLIKKLKILFLKLEHFKVKKYRI